MPDPSPAAADAPEAEELLAREHTSLPVPPVTWHRPESRTIRVEAPPEEVDESYRTQCYESPLPWLVRLVPAALPDAIPGPVDPLRLLTAWNPRGERRTAQDNRLAQEGLEAALGDRFLAAAVAVPPTRAWFEEVLVARDVDDDEALDLAVRFGQPALVTWQGDSLRVEPTGVGVAVTPVSLPASLVWREPACPLRRDQEPGGRCFTHGGPWVSASIHAAALWGAHRTVAVKALGCGPCQNGKLPIHGPGGRGLSLAPCYVGSRYGGTSWQ